MGCVCCILEDLIESALSRDVILQCRSGSRATIKRSLGRTAPNKKIPGVIGKIKSFTAEGVMVLLAMTMLGFFWVQCFVLIFIIESVAKFAPVPNLKAIMVLNSIYASIIASY